MQPCADCSSTYCCAGPFPARESPLCRSAAAAKTPGMWPMALPMTAQLPESGRKRMSLICRLHPQLHLLRYSTLGMALISCTDYLTRSMNLLDRP